MPRRRTPGPGSSRGWPAGSPQARIAAVYSAYTDTAAIEARGLAPAKPYLDRIAAIRNRDDLLAAFATPGISSPLAAGVAADALTGKLGGVPSDEQTAAQVEQRRGQPTTVVLREWERSASQFELVLTKAGPSILPAAIDVAVHEHDIRGALDLPGGERLRIGAEARDAAARPQREGVRFSRGAG